MKYVSAMVVVCALGVSAAWGCAGKLEVGDASGGQKVQEGANSTGGATASGSGGATGGVAGGTGGATTGATTGVVGAIDGNEVWPDAPPTPPDADSSEGCPTGPLAPQASCETEGLTCEYAWVETPGERIRQECSCARTWDDQQIWRCFQDYNSESCPSDPPEDASDCDGSFGLDCSYEQARPLDCSCDAERGTWDCRELNPEQEVPDAPLALDAGKLVAELSDDERLTWCEWYSGVAAGGPGYPPLSDGPVTDGYAGAQGCMYDGGLCGAALPKVSVAQCVANLSLSECESPLANLTGCTIDMFGMACTPFDYDCLDYLETPNCKGTILLRASEVPGPFCSVRVE